ncbi:MAG: SRPBCC family protein [Pseudomonadota bacterium]
MKKILTVLAVSLVFVFVVGFGFLALSPNLRSDPGIGLSPETHAVGTLDVRQYTDAPLRAEVKIFLPLPVNEAVPIVADFASYEEWVSPPPENVVVDNSARPSGDFGVGSLVSYKANETDEIVFYNPSVAMIARPRWGLDDFTGHHGVVIVTPYEHGSIMHMRRYFETVTLKGWFMSKMMPMFMEKSAENLAKQHGGRLL